MIILIFQSVAPATEILNDFNEEIDSGYQAYTIIKEESHQYYDLKIIQGVNDDKISFGIMLANVNPQSHTIKVSMNNRQYVLSKSNRGDYNHPAIKYNSDIIINIDDGVSVKPIAEISHITPEQFLAGDNIITGDNQGLRMEALGGSGINLNRMGLLSFIFGGVIIFTSIIIFIFYKRRKGIFAEHKRKENVFDYREFVNQYVANNTEEAVAHGNYVVPEEDIKEEVQIPQKAYERQRFYEEEVEDFIDVEKILKEKGFNTDYQNALEFEKNEIMLELMKMRDLREISQTQYHEEAIKLWKK